MTYTIDSKKLVNLAKKLFIGAGVRERDAHLVASGLVAANLRGVDSHGVSRVPVYIERIQRGVVNPNPSVKVEKVTAAVSKVNGDNGMGFVTASHAMDEAIELAKSSGIGLVGVNHSTHFGMAALYVMQAIKSGYIGLAYTNSSPAIPVWGGRNALLGSSPFAAGVPSKENNPYVLDMAMTVIARGKIRLAAKQDKEIPEGLALDKQGAPTTNAKEAMEGVFLPFGGVKGSSLSMLMDILSGVLTGANYGGEVKSLYTDPDQPQNVGHLFIAIRPDLFVPLEQFEQRMETFVNRIKSQPRAEGFDEILIPGEPEERKAQERLRTGIPLTKEVINSLVSAGNTLGIDINEYILN